MRRTAVMFAAKKIFVTDPCLVEHAKSLQPKCKNKISYICFGRYDSISKFKQTPFEEKNILEWIERIRRIKPDSMIGLSVTTPAKKNITADLIDRLLAANDNLYFVLVGFNMKDKYSSRVLNIKNNFDIYKN